MSRVSRLCGIAALSAVATIAASPVAMAFTGADPAPSNDTTAAVAHLFTFEKSSEGQSSISGTSCTGTLIAPDWVVTAKHCLGTKADDQYKSRITFGTETTDTKYESTKIISNKDTDIALVHLEKAPEGVTPVKVWDKGTANLPETSTGTAYGWSEKEGDKVVTAKNLTTTTGQLSNKRITVEENEGKFAGQIPAYPVTFDKGLSVNGDSGGPLMLDGSIFGTLSGAITKEGVEFGKVAVYVPLSEYAEWINATVGEDVVDEDQDNADNQDPEDSENVDAQPPVVDEGDTKDPDATPVDNAGEAAAPSSTSPTQSTTVEDSANTPAPAPSLISAPAVSTPVKEGPQVNTGGEVQAASLFTKVKNLF